MKIMKSRTIQFNSAMLSLSKKSNILIYLFFKTFAKIITFILLDAIGIQIANVILIELWLLQIYIHYIFFLCSGLLDLCSHLMDIWYLIHHLKELCSLIHYLMEPVFFVPSYNRYVLTDPLFNRTMISGPLYN